MEKERERGRESECEKVRKRFWGKREKHGARKQERRRCEEEKEREKRKVKGKEDKEGWGVGERNMRFKRKPKGNCCYYDTIFFASFTGALLRASLCLTLFAWDGENVSS